MKKTGFTLIELLVVIAIISVLMALTLPAVQNARESARQTVCAGKMRQMHLVAIIYGDTYRCVLPSYLGYSSTNDTYPPYWYGQELLYEADLLPRNHIKSYTGIPNESTVGTLRKTSILLCPSGEYYWPNSAPVSTWYANDPTWDIMDSLSNWAGARNGANPSWYTGSGNATLFGSYGMSSKLRKEVPNTSGPAPLGDIMTPLKEITEPPSRKLLFIEARVNNFVNATYMLNEESSTQLGRSVRNFRFPHFRSANFINFDGHVESINKSRFLEFDYASTPTRTVLEQNLPFIF